MQAFKSSYFKITPLYKSTFSTLFYRRTSFHKQLPIVGSNSNDVLLKLLYSSPTTSPSHNSSTMPAHAIFDQVDSLLSKNQMLIN